jgi:hypothetical protein
MQRSTITRERLDGTVVDIEFLLIAVIQGFALATLAVDSETVITEGMWVYFPYILAAFILILNFWALAIQHSISFIAWPFDLTHTLLYLLVAFVEVASFSQITHPGTWFVFMLAFFIVSGMLYAWDLKMIRDRRAEFEDTPARRTLYAHILNWQESEVRFLLPSAIGFELVVVGVLWQWPALILEENRHLWVISAQLLFGLAYLAVIMRGYRRRQELISACAEESEAAAA